MPESSTRPPLVLASTSPFRKALLQRLGLAFETVAPAVDESALPGETPQQLVTRLAILKAAAVGATHRGLIIGSDQVAGSGDRRPSSESQMPTWRRPG